MTTPPCIGFALLSALLAQVPISARTHSDSPLSWRETRANPAISAASATDLAKRYLGGEDVEVASQQLVSITDRDTLGYPVHDRLVYLTRCRFLHVSQSTADSVRVDLFVAVDAHNGGLVVAFTPAKDEWVPRMEPRRRTDEEAGILGWTVGPPPSEGMKSSVEDVLHAASGWRRAFVDARQIVIRPRWVIQKFPARMEGDTLISIRPPAAAWIIHTMGVVLNTSAPPPGPNGGSGVEYYFTESLMLVADSTLVVGPCGYMP